MRRPPQNPMRPSSTRPSLTRHTLTRRALLQGATGAALALPLLQSLPARAQAAAFPKRLVIWFTPNGFNPETWFPAAGSTEDDFTLGRVLAPLQVHQRRLIMTSGLNLRSAEVGPGEPHQKGMGAVLTGTHLQQGDFIGGDGSRAGWGNGQSIDQYLVERIGQQTRLPSIEMGVRVRGSEVRHRLNYRAAATPLPPIESPLTVWNRLFANQMLGDQAQNQQIRDRRSVLDAVRKQFAQLRTKVTPEDRLKLDAHATMVRDIERRLLLPLPGEFCAPSEQPPLINPGDENSLAPTVDLNIDLAVAALACDQTRIITLQNSSGANNIRFPHLNSNPDDHQLSHAGPAAGDSRNEWARRQTWYAQKFRRLLDGMASVREGDGTLLDNSLVLWCSELAQGATHSHDNMPFLIAGSCGGALRTGRWVDFGGRNHNDLLMTIAQAFGHPVESFGDPDYCTGALETLLT